MKRIISWVLLTGEYAYKIKKPVNLGFADFTTLGLRRYYCEEELRLNRRLAPGSISMSYPYAATRRAPRIGGDGPVLDYAVKMREFPQEALASRAGSRSGAFGAAEIDALAARGRGIPCGRARARGRTDAGHARGGAVRRAAELRADAAARQEVARRHYLARAAPLDRARVRRAAQAAFEARQRGGFVRECHGDLHLGNIVVLDGRPVPFDCIEFNEELRWIDVMSEVAFVAMDLEDRGRGDLAWRFLNRYLEATGDYAGLGVLRFHLVYRALVRAKVHLMRSRQPRLRRAEKYRARAGLPRLPAVGRALCGAGSALLSFSLTASPDAARLPRRSRSSSCSGRSVLRSDLERKRLHGLASLAASGSELGGRNLHSRSDRRDLPAAGRCWRRLLSTPAFPSWSMPHSSSGRSGKPSAPSRKRSDVPFLILDFHAPLEVVRARIAERLARADDASEADLAVLEHQLAAREPLTPAEMAATFAVDATGPVSHDMWCPFIERLRRSAGGHARVPRARAGHPDHGRMRVNSAGA